jgi:hypothetical protein
MLSKGGDFFTSMHLLLFRVLRWLCAFCPLALLVSLLTCSALLKQILGYWPQGTLGELSTYDSSTPLLSSVSETAFLLSFCLLLSMVFLWPCILSLLESPVSRREKWAWPMVLVANWLLLLFEPTHRFLAYLNWIYLD